MTMVTCLKLVTKVVKNVKAMTQASARVIDSAQCVQPENDHDSNEETLPVMGSDTVAPRPLAPGQCQLEVARGSARPRPPAPSVVWARAGRAQGSGVTMTVRSIPLHRLG